MSVNGIDIASYQSSTYSAVGLDFVLVKATEGGAYVNPRHAGQIATGHAHSLVVGHYHFVRPGSMTAQAAYFLQHAAPAAGDILCLDWEDTGVSSADKDAWIRHVQAAAPGHRVILYCNRDFWLNRDTTSFCGDGLWIADPGSAAGHPQVAHPWLFHQYSEAGGLDHDVANFPTRAALQAWAAGQPLNPEDTMPTAQEIADAVWAKQLPSPADPKGPLRSAGTFLRYGDAHTAQILTAVNQGSEQTLAAVRALVPLIGTGADTDQIIAALRAELASTVVHVEVTGLTPPDEPSAEA